MDNKVLIVGFGLAGAVLAFKLEQLGIEFEILDTNQVNSSQIAAGIYNPLVFRRLLKSWRADEFIPNLIEFYTYLEEKLETQFHFPINILKFISSEDEKYFWNQKIKEGELSQYLPNQLIENYKPDFVNQQTAYAQIQQSGYVRLDLFLDAAKNYFDKLNKIKFEKMDFELLDASQEPPKYKDEEYRYIIFAEGYKVTENPYFSYLPFVFAKGEILNVHIPEAKIEFIGNRDVFILPIGSDIYRVGATYTWDEIDEQATEVAQEELRYKLEKMISVSYEVKEHLAGVRPATIDRRPIIGQHPLYPSLAIFNGLGAKGVMLAPTICTELLENLFESKQIDSEYNLSRFENYRLGIKKKNK